MLVLSSAVLYSLHVLRLSGAPHAPHANVCLALVASSVPPSPSNTRPPLRPSRAALAPAVPPLRLAVAKAGAETVYAALAVCALMTALPNSPPAIEAGPPLCRAAAARRSADGVTSRRVALGCRWPDSSRRSARWGTAQRRDALPPTALPAFPAAPCRPRRFLLDCSTGASVTPRSDHPRSSPSRPRRRRLRRRRVCVAAACVTAAFRPLRGDPRGLRGLVRRRDGGLHHLGAVLWAELGDERDAGGPPLPPPSPRSLGARPSHSPTATGSVRRQANLIYTTQPLWSVLFAALLVSEVPTSSEALGGAVIAAALWLAASDEAAQAGSAHAEDEASKAV